MPEKQPQPPRRPELTNQQLERLMKVELEKGTSWPGLAAHLREGKQATYIIDKRSLQVFVSIHIHKVLFDNVGVKYEDSLLSNAFFEINQPTPGTVTFKDYSVNEEIEGKKNVKYALRICSVAREKIKEFLNARGIEVR